MDPRLGIPRSPQNENSLSVTKTDPNPSQPQRIQIPPPQLHVPSPSQSEGDADERKGTRASEAPLAGDARGGQALTFSPVGGRVRNCFRSEVTTAFGRVGARICSIPGRSGWFQTCLPAVGRAKRRARPMRAYARAGPSDSFTALTMLYAMLLSSSSVSPLASPV